MKKVAQNVNTERASRTSYDLQHDALSLSARVRRTGRRRSKARRGFRFGSDCGSLGGPGLFSRRCRPQGHRTEAHAVVLKAIAATQRNGAVHEQCKRGEETDPHEITHYPQ